MSRIVKENLLKLEGNGKTLEISTQIQEHTAVMRLSGEINAELQDDFLDELLAFVSVGKNIRLDFSALDYIAETASKKLIDIQRNYIDRAGLKMEICGVPDKIYAIFRASRLTALLDIRRDG